MIVGRRILRNMAKRAAWPRKQEHGPCSAGDLAGHVAGEPATAASCSLSGAPRRWKVPTQVAALAWLAGSSTAMLDV